MNPIISVASCTLGDSAARLRIFLEELRRFTDVSFRQVVVDDGTISEELKAGQREACREFGAEWVPNEGPVFGISHAWNHALAQIETPWCFCVEDGLRPGRGWLESALSAVELIGEKRWGPRQRRVGMMGIASIQDWALSMGMVWPGSDLMKVYRQEETKDFKASGWNDGEWCWGRLMPGIQRAVADDTGEWEADLAEFRNLFLTGDPTRPHGGRTHPTNIKHARVMWETRGRWPQRRTATCHQYPGAFMLVDMRLWREMGGFRDGCMFFEGHYSIRLGMAGHLVLAVESVPFLHSPSWGFKAKDFGRTPRDHRPVDEVFMADFGVSHLDAPQMVECVVSPLEQRLIDEELSRVELWMHEDWRKYL